MAVAGKRLSSMQETVRSLEEVAKSSGHLESQFRGFEVDVSSSESVNTLVECVAREFPHSPLSVTVNAAGIVRDSLLLKQSEEEFDDVIRVNLKVSAVLFE